MTKPLPNIAKAIVRGNRKEGGKRETTNLMVRRAKTVLPPLSPAPPFLPLSVRRIRGIAGRRRGRGETVPGERRTDNYESHKSCIVYSPFPAVSRVSSVLPPFPDCLLLHAGVRACVRACPTCVVWISRRLEEERKKKRGKDTHVRGGVPLDVSAAVSFGLEKTVLGTKEKGGLRSATAVGSQEKFLLKMLRRLDLIANILTKLFFLLSLFQIGKRTGNTSTPDVSMRAFSILKKQNGIFLFLYVQMVPEACSGAVPHRRRRPRRVR